MHRSLLRVAIAAGLCGLVPAQAAPAPCFDPNLGTRVGEGDDVVLPAVTLNAPFSFGGTNYPTWSPTRPGSRACTTARCRAAT